MSPENAPEYIFGRSNFQNFPEEAPRKPQQEGDTPSRTLPHVRLCRTAPLRGALVSQVQFNFLLLLFIKMKTLYSRLRNSLLLFHFDITISFLLTVNQKSFHAYFPLTTPHNPERRTLISDLCQGVFTDQFIFRHILGHVFLRKWNPHHVYEHIRSTRYQKGKLNVIKRQKNIIFRPVGFADGLVELKRYSKFGPKPF